jgi:Lrp/AsnC family leucine-responsive transcriptional regulator
MPRFEEILEIEECHHVAGEADYILKLRARDMEHLGDVIRRVQVIPNVFSTQTDVVFTTGFERRPLALGKAADEIPETVPGGDS